jgi:hypothetical protein
MIRLVIAALLLAAPALAETCPPGTTMRVVQVWPRTAVVQYPTAVKCHPGGGWCWVDPPFAAHGDARGEMRCLTPGQVRDAEDRGS